MSVKIYKTTREFVEAIIKSEGLNRTYEEAEARYNQIRDKVNSGRETHTKMTKQEKIWVSCAEMYGIKMTEPFNPHRIKIFRKKSAHFRSEMRRWVKWAMREAQSERSRGIIRTYGSEMVKRIIREDQIWARENHQPKPTY